jgi:hypothetical protein
MSLTIEDFSYNVSEGDTSVSGGSSDVEVFGEPYHTTKGELVDKYRTQTTEEFVTTEKAY